MSYESYIGQRQDEEGSLIAIVHTSYGPPDVLELRELERPTPKDNEVLIKVHAATVTAEDCELRRFDIMPLFWLPLRLYMGIRKPRGVRILGQEQAGEVETVGKEVTRFKPGDHVFGSTGFRLSAHAEYCCVTESSAIAIKPPNLSFEEAAGIPVGGQNALHFLRKAEIQPGHEVLIYGSSGSIGTFAVQLAKYFGAEVTAVCSTGKIEMVKSIGADHIVDYTREDFTENGQAYDIIFDTIGKSPFSGSMRALKEDGIYIQANPKLSHMLRGPLKPLRGNRRVILQPAAENAENLAFLAELSRPARSSLLSTGAIRWSKWPRPTAMSSKATRPAMSSSPWLMATTEVRNPRHESGRLSYVVNRLLVTMRGERPCRMIEHRTQAS